VTVRNKCTTETAPDYFNHVIFEVVYSLGMSGNVTKCSVDFTSGAASLQPTPRSLSFLSGVVRYTISAVYHREAVLQSGLCRGCVLVARLTLGVPFTWRSYLALTDESRCYKLTSHGKHVTQTCLAAVVTWTTVLFARTLHFLVTVLIHRKPSFIIS